MDTRLTKEEIERMDPNAAAVRLLLEKHLDEEQDKKKKSRFKNIDAQIAWNGTTITLPAEPGRMTIPEAREWFDRFERTENEEIAVHEIVEAFPFDGAIAFMKALQRTYGWAAPVPTQTFFGPEPPAMMSVDISPTERTQIIWGKFKVPGIDGELATGVGKSGNRLCFVLGGQIRKKHAQAVAEIAELTRKIVREESIYRSKAVRLAISDKGNLNLSQPPSFVDVSQASPEELIFSESLNEQVETNLWAPILHTDLCRANKIPLKRTVLMEGPFGTGKTLAAYVTALKATESGWTFIMLDRVSALAASINFAVQYQPCVIFCEDIDRETSGERTLELDEILNTVDGLVSKGKEIMVVLTSNNAERINRALMRPGRIDAVLSIAAPDKAAAERLMRLYGRKLIADDESLEHASVELDGQIPAVIRECVERAKLYAISRNPTSKITLVDSDLVHAARGMKRHLELLSGVQPDTRTEEHKFGEALATVVQKSVGQSNGKPLYNVAQEILEKFQ